LEILIGTITFLTFINSCNTSDSRDPLDLAFLKSDDILLHKIKNLFKNDRDFTKMETFTLYSNVLLQSFEKHERSDVNKNNFDPKHVCRDKTIKFRIFSKRFILSQICISVNH